MTVRRSLAAIADPMAGAPDARLGEARAARRAGELKRALRLLEALYAEFPNDVRVWHEQAHFALSVKDYERAKGILETVAEGTRWLEPQPLFQLGGLAERRGDYGEACIWYQKCLRAHAHKADNTGIVMVYIGLQNCLMRLGDWAGARDWTKRILLAARQHLVGGALGTVLDPGSQYQAALTVLAQGDWEQGWRLFEARHLLPEHIADRRYHHLNEKMVPEKTWDGTTEERVLVLPEQGTGDVIQFVRYLPLVAARTQKPVVVVVPDQLKTWLDGLYRDITVVTSSTMGGWPTDSHVWIMSLPHVLGYKGPPPLPFYHPRYRWHGRAAGATPRVGICWHGEKGYANDKDRSAPDVRTLLDPLREGLPGAEFISLQFGEALEPGGAVFREDYDKTAALMSTLDLIVTVDTGSGHMAGNLGIPTLMLAQTVDDYRFPRYWGTDKTPWYPSMRVIRRDASRDWGVAMEKAVMAAREMLGYLHEP